MIVKYGVCMPNQVFKPWDSPQMEKTHLQFCKRLKEVNSKASNVACKAELDYILALRIINKVF